MMWRIPNQKLVVYAFLWFIAFLLWFPLNAIFGMPVVPVLPDLLLHAIYTVLSAACVGLGVHRVGRRFAIS